MGGRSLTTEEFIGRAREVHGDEYDYSLVDYKSNNIKVKIICQKHGVFNKTLIAHVNQKAGCKKCYLESLSKKLSKTTEDFIRRAREVHGDEYDYSLVDYVNSYTKVRVICQKHGEFTPEPKNHVNSKSGCPKCYDERRWGSGVGGYSQQLFDNNPELKLERILIYLVEIKGENESFFKIGLTKNSIKERCCHITDYKHKEIFSKRVNFYKGFLLEQSIIDSDQYPSYKPKHKFGGYTECLTLTKCEVMDIISRIDKLQ